MSKQPQWQPISKLSLIAHHIDSMLQAVQEQYKLLLSAKVRLHALDTYIVNRVKEVTTSQQDDLWIFDTQLVLWLSGKLTQEQRIEVERLVEQMTKLQEQMTAILILVDDLKKGTIEKVLGKGDAEPG